MEIQFSIPINPAQKAPSQSKTISSPGSRASEATQPRGRGGTHRFALDSRTRHTRRSSTRARTGCGTCKKRHVKCDETRPACLNCMKWRGYCDTYNDDRADNAASKLSTSSAGKLIHTKKAPLICDEPSINAVRFENNQQRAYFDEWSGLSVAFLSGGLAHTRLWTATMPQLTLNEPTLRYGAMAIGALRKAYLHAGQHFGTALTTSNQHYLNAIIFYCEALRLQAKATPDREGLRTAMLSSLLFICFETLRANMPAALKHITHGFTMLNELSQCTNKAPDLVSIAPAPPSLVEEILDCYKPLELQSRSFIGPYKKFFFAPGSRSPGQASAGSTGPVTSPNSSTPPPMLSPVSQPDTTWRASGAPTSPPSQAPQAGLPSPQSQNSPGSHGGQQTPPRPGASQRPPGILPFTKHSPYFRPRLSNVTRLEDLPQAFSSFGEAQGYWSLLQKQMVQYIPLLTVTTSQLGLTKVTDEEELSRKLASVKESPRISKFIAESRYWLQRWIEAFDPLFTTAARNRDRDPRPYLHAANLRIEYLILYIYTAIPRYSGLITAKGLTPQYREINRLAEILLQAQPSCGFSMDSGWTWPLFVASFGCREPSVRADAIRILHQYPIRNALRDSRVFRAIALRNEVVEHENLAHGDNEQAQWMRLRRRELVFEDFGTNIIYRRARYSEMEGKWVLIEEAAEFTVQEDGTLNWQEQPISESASILSGVC